MPVTIAPARPEELEAVVALVVRTVTATYGAVGPALSSALSSDPVGVMGGSASWTHALVAREGAALVGVAATVEDRVTNLWVDPSAQGRGIGALLLAAAEVEIAARGPRVARLRLVASNARALAFYTRHGWLEIDRNVHARWGEEMVNMEKPL